MRIAVISDVHANLHALERVLEAVEEERVEALWCLGDTVGYGPRPNECCARVAERADVCLAGNHDLLALGKEVYPEDFNPDASMAGLWTRSVLSDAARAFLDGLEPEARLERAQLFHASARDPVWEYVLSSHVARATLEVTDAPAVLVGHSHVPLAISLVEGQLDGGYALPGTEIELGSARWLLNPGSVGQPRDGDPRAAWLLIDFGQGSASFRRIDYAIAKTQDEIRAAGLSASLAERLASGL